MNGKWLGLLPQNRFFELLHISPEINYPDECTRNVSADAETSEWTEDGFILRESRLSDGNNTSQFSSVGRLKVLQATSHAMINPEFPGRCAWPFQLLSRSLRSSLSLSFFFPSRSFLAATAAPSPRFAYLAAFNRPVANNPTEESLTSSSAGCNKKKPPTARSATRYTPTRCEYPYRCARACVRTWVSQRLLPRPGEPPSGQVTKLNSNIIK